MPKYKITDHETGKTVIVSGDAPPSDSDAESIFRDAGLRDPALAQAAPAPQAAPISPVADAIRSIPGGIAKGVASVVGLPGDVSNLFNAGGDKLLSLMGESPDVIKKMQSQREALPIKPVSSAQVNKAVSDPFGGYYQPQTKAGQYTETVASFAPNALAPGSIPAKLARMVIPGVASEAAGQATKGSKYEGLARAGGALLGGIGEGLGEGMLLKAPKAPTLAELGDMKNKAYQAADQAGVVIRPDAFQKFATDLGDDLTKNNVVQADIHKNALSALNVIQDEAASGAPMSLSRADAVRKAVNGAIEKAANPMSGSRDDLRLAMKVKSGLDDFLDNLKPTDTLSGDASVAVPILKEARSLAAKQYKGEQIQEIIDLAQNSASTNYSASGYEQALRVGFKNLNAKMIKDPNLAKTFTDAEREAIVKVAKGGAIGNGLRLLGKFSPTGPVSSGMASVVGGGLGGGVGSLVGGPVGGAIGGLAGAAALGGTGALARSGATAITSRNAQAVSDLVRGGAPAASQGMTPKLLTGLLLSQAAHQ